jgi:hypothetical protein
MNIRNGVKGHRILAEIPELLAGFDTVWEEIEQRFPGEELWIYSNLAEGADRLVAHQVLQRGGSLVTILPLSPEDYQTEFQTPNLLQEFKSLLSLAGEIITMPAAGSRKAAYESAGLFILDLCDILLAVWDGLVVQGQENAGEIVMEARRQGLSLA